MGILKVDHVGRADQLSFTSGDLMDKQLTVARQEQERIQALRRYQILDTPADGAFDRITELAAQLFQVPIAIVSLVDTDRIWFKSHYGLNIAEVERELGLCASAIMGELPYILPDASRDPRSLSNPLVAGEFGLRFYAGIPLQTHDDYNLGVLCIIDLEPRTITAAEIATLKTLAHLVMDQMELRLAARRVNELHQELLEAHDALRIQATHDALTGLLNRGTIMELLQKTIALAYREHRPLAVMLADVDFFKQINDEYGHLVGDQVLTEIARRLKQTCRGSDSIGRYGGEEFLLVMYPCSMEEAEVIAERFRSAVGATAVAIGEDAQRTINVSISAGIVSTEVDSEAEAQQILQRTDAMLYISKEAGRNCVTAGSIAESIINKSDM